MMRVPDDCRTLPSNTPVTQELFSTGYYQILNKMILFNKIDFINKNGKLKLPVDYT